MHNGSMFAPELCYSAMKARDRRFDGRFFVAVSSTRIYCRPICTVKLPKLVNCSFYASPARAESQGYRPCRRCRPELAPGSAASVDAVRTLASRAAALIDSGGSNEEGVVQLARRLGVSDRHLRRVFESEFGVSPVQWAQTRRLLVAKQLLTDTALPVTEIAFASGFASLRRFNALFLERYRLSPQVFRKAAAPERPAATSASLQFQLAYRPPYAWQQQLEFFSARSIPGIDMVDTSAASVQHWVYRRTLCIGKSRGWIAVSQDAERCTLRIEVSATLTKVIVAVLDLVRRVFDLGCHPEQIDQALSAGEGGLTQLVPGLRVPGAFGGLECAVRAVLGQQVTVKAATTLSRRLVAVAAQHADLAVQTPWPELCLVFPSADQLAGLTVDDIASQGIIASRAQAILAIAALCQEFPHFLSVSSDYEVATAQLLALPGVGEWTASYIAMRALQWPDSFLAKDVVVLKALGLVPELSVQRAQAQASVLALQWQPWRSYAVLQLWHGAMPKSAKGII
jgi:AraC family transcriptional regulator, regulatory protein of adaptative response / DNA-3-methyladenine glycosylase II